MTYPLNPSDITQCFNLINQIPTHEIKYYLLLMLNTLKKAPKEKADICDALLTELTQLSGLLTACFDSDNQSQLLGLLQQVHQHYQNMSTLSTTNTASVAIGYALINVGSVISAFFTGVLGGLIGGISGLARGLYNGANPLKYIKDGLITGIAFGGAIGFRAPKKLFKDELTRQLKFCLDGFAESIQGIQKIMPLSHYEQEVKKELLTHCFNDDEEAYQAFLKSRQDYKIIAFNAQFVSEQLEGYLGHHSCIVLNLPNQDTMTTIEFAPKQSEVGKRQQTQIDHRIVTGAKIVEMMAFHKQLKVTHQCDMNYMLLKMKSGETDCLSYLNKVLIGSNQEATKIRRFDGSENWVGRNVVGFFVQKLSPFRKDILDSKDELHQNSDSGCDDSLYLSPQT